MKVLFPSLVVFSFACAASDADQPVVVSEFVEVSEPVACTEIDELPASRPVGDVQVAGDSLLLVLYSQEREVVLYDRDLIPLHTIPFAEVGPGGVAAPVAATLLQDSLIYLADRARQQLKILDLEGVDLGTFPLDFAPDRLLATGDRLFVTPIVMGSTPASLLHVVDAGSLRSLKVPTKQYADLTVNGLGNMVDIEIAPGEGILVAHRFLRPIAYVVDDGGEGFIQRRTTPIPESMRSNVGRIPNVPITEDQLGDIATPIISLAADLATGEMLYLTRSGRSLSDYSEKAIVRVDAELGYRESYLLDVNATDLAHFAGSDASIVVDDQDRWYRCRTR